MSEIEKLKAEIAQKDEVIRQLKTLVAFIQRLSKNQKDKTIWNIIAIADAYTNQTMI